MAGGRGQTGRLLAGQRRPSRQARGAAARRTWGRFVARHRQLFDAARYRIVQFDQRGCGSSTPSAATPEVDLLSNTTSALVADIERLRTYLGIERWLVWGGSWGTTLALAYAQAHPASVSELVLAAVVSTSAAEVEWIDPVDGADFPERWQRFVEALPPEDRDGDLALAYNRLLMDPDRAVHGPAALGWCEWEDAHVSLVDGYRPDLSERDPAYRLAFARLVTHYWSNAGFLEEGQLLREAGRLTGIPTFLTHGRRDISSPAGFAVEVAGAIPGAELFISESDGHGGPEMTDWLISVTDRLAG